MGARFTFLSHDRGEADSNTHPEKLGRFTKELQRSKKKQVQTADMKLNIAFTILAYATSALGETSVNVAARGDVLFRRESGNTDSGNSSSTALKELSSESFNDKNMKGLWYVEFFSPYCAKCKEVGPKWTAAFEKYGGNDDALTWGQVNCVEEGDLCKAQKITSFPQIHVYNNGALVDKYEYSLEEGDFYLFARLLQKYGAAAFGESLKEMKDIVDVEEKELKKTPDEKDKDAAEAHEGNVNGNVVDEMSKILENSVAELTEKDWDGPRLNKLWFIKFHSPYTSESRDFAPKWKEAFMDLGGIFGTWGMGMAWGEVNCHKSPDLCKRLGVTEFPSLRVFLDRELIHKYDGPREPEDLKSFAKHAIEEWAPKDDEGNLMEVTISRGDDSADEASKEATSKPTSNDYTLEDAIVYALKTGGKRVEGDPGLLVFGEDAETQHGIRTFKEHDAPPPSWDDIVASYAKGESVPLDSAKYHSLVEGGKEPWFIKFFSPRCPHCLAMAPEWVKLARHTEGRVNIAEIDCDADLQLCLDLGVKAFPTLRFYHKDKLQPDYLGARDASAMEMYALMQTGGKIIPIDTMDEVWGNVTINVGESRSSFVYLYDKSVMPEDWEALGAFAARMAPLDGVVYRADNRDIVDRFGIHHHGPTLAFVGAKDSGESESNMYSIPYRLSNVPLKLRDPKLLEQWAHTVMFSSAQLLRQTEIPFMNDLAPVHLVFLLPPGSGNLPTSVNEKLFKLRKLAANLYEEAEERRRDAENALRIERLLAHDEAVERGEYALANKLSKFVIDVPLQLNLTISYIPLDKWQEQYNSYFDVSQHVEGQFVVFDPYNKVYVDSMDKKPFTELDQDLIQVAVDAVRTQSRDKSVAVKKAYAQFKGVEKFNERLSLHFKDMRKATRPSVFSVIPTRFLVALVVTVVVYALYRQFLRPSLRQRRTLRSGILTGKMD